MTAQPAFIASFGASLAALRPGGDGADKQRGWAPGAQEPCRHGEIFAAAGEAAGAALALALAADGLRAARPDPAADTPDTRPWLWVQDPAALRLSGRPYRPGLPAPLRHRLIHVAARSVEEALFALEEGVRCRDLAFVVGEIAGNPRALTFTASRRLSLAAEHHGVPLWLVRLDARRDLSSARMRWEARAATSLPPRRDAHAPGRPAWHAELFRARNYPPGQWILRDDATGLVAGRAAAHGAVTPDSLDLAGAARA